MSAGDSDYIDTYDPDGNVLRFWYNKWHCNSKTNLSASTEETKKSAVSIIRRFERFLASEAYDCHWTDIYIGIAEEYEVEYDDLDPTPRNVTPQLAEEFLVTLVENFESKTQQHTFATLKQAYGWCEEWVESVDLDPFQKVEKKWKQDRNNWLLESPEGRDPHIISPRKARNVVRAWDSFRYQTVQLVFGKYPRRAGGVSNLDICDVHLDHPGCDWNVHQDIRRWPDHILFRSDKRESEEGRNTGNKTKTNAKYPIDEELKEFLLAYLARRHTILSPDDPLFLGSKGGRLSGKAMTTAFSDHAKELGHFYGPGHDDNLNPHYWRHWATSWYDPRFGGDADTSGYTALTDYLRGDSRSEIKSLYSNYTEAKRDRILDAMPKFHKPFIDS